MNKPSITFIANFHKTIFFHAIALRLKEQGVAVSWISPSWRWTNWLLKQGILEEEILQVHQYVPLWLKQGNTEYSQLKKIEAVNEVCINDVLLMDRCLRHRNFDESKIILEGLSKSAELFLKKHAVKFVFGEQTWAHEIIIAQTAKANNIHFARPHVIRIPDKRFGFFKNHLDKDLYRLTGNTIETQVAKDFYVHYLENKPKPTYFKLNNKKYVLKLRLIKAFFKHLYIAYKDKHDLSRFSISYLVRYNLKRAWNAKLLSQVISFIDKPDMNQAFVLLTLHKQPEHSIDVLGSLFSDQLKTIEAIARKLPVNTLLYVKEHSNAYGDRPTSFYRSLNNIPNVCLISADINSAELIEKAACTISVAGTACYEAGLLQRKSVCMSEMFFNPLLQCTKYNPYIDSIQEIIDADLNSSEEKAVNFLQYVIEYSSGGYISDPKSDPNCLSSDNVDEVVNGFLMLMHTHSD